MAITIATPACAVDVPPDRKAMVDTIRAHAAAGATPISERTLEAMAAVAREEFVPEGQKSLAYRDSPLPIGQGQTISQPYIVALMTELADIVPGEVVLEVGTGSGYQAAVLAKLGARVFTVEIVEPLAKQAEQRLKTLGFTSVEVRSGDGYAGWPEHAPFDAILVTAAPDKVPPPLIEQLRSGGKLVVPVGKDGGPQEMTVIEKSAEGNISTRKVLPVRFVPLTGDH